MTDQGMVYIFTGNGKGKTSAALGVAMRAVSNGMKVAMVQWYKEASWRTSERELARQIPSFELYPMGRGFHIGAPTAPLSNGQVVVDKTDEQTHRKAAQEALAFSLNLLGKVDVLILDEINNAVAEGLVTVEAVLSLLQLRKSTHLILTGRNADAAVIEAADLVTEMKKIKHPYDTGKLAIKGLDF